MADIGIIMNTMRDSAGLPAHPSIFQALMLLTWVFHIVFVHLTLGAAGLAIWAYVRRDSHVHWARLSEAMTKVAKVGVSLLIVLGVAPLLFTQVIYDPQWYASNVLSARWAIAFIFTLIIAYSMWFYFYAQNHGRRATRFMAVFAGAALGLFVLDGLIMHVLSYQALLPGQWQEWYAPGGVVDTSGSKLHAMQPARFLFIMGLSVPAIGLYLLAYADYVGARADADAAYLDRVRKLGAVIAWRGAALSAVLMVAWQLTNPFALGLWKSPLGWVLVLWCVALALWVKSRKHFEGLGYAALGSGVAMTGILAAWREVIRIAHLSPLGYSIVDYPVHADMPSLTLFALTLLGVGGLVGGYYLRLIYQAGLTVGTYTAGKWTSRWGTAAVGVLVVWIMVFFAYGINIYIGNVFK